ncbi:MAG: pantetheine-phosphate adenylyltransferase [Eubacterium sp.]|jgi:pantetheine-phosphate adenylyltransferase
MSIAIYPGSFDPLTYGHLDIIERSSQMADKLIVAVLCNSAKNPLFSTDERVSMIKDLTAHIPNVSVDTFDGLTAEYADRVGATIVVRGLRAVTDFEYELQIAQTNRIVNPKLDTIFLTTNLKYSYLSSTIVKEVAQYNGDISHFVPPSIADRVRSKFSKNKEA